MGTHPIFESDFDCLTVSDNKLTMSFAELIDGAADLFSFLLLPIGFAAALGFFCCCFCCTVTAAKEQLKALSKPVQGANLVNGKSNDRVDGIILPMKSQPPKRTREKTTVHVGKTEKIEIKQLNVFI